MIERDGIMANFTEMQPVVYSSAVNPKYMMDKNKSIRKKNIHGIVETLYPTYLLRDIPATFYVDDNGDRHKHPAYKAGTRGPNIADVSCIGPNDNSWGTNSNIFSGCCIKDDANIHGTQLNGTSSVSGFSTVIDSSLEDDADVTDTQMERCSVKGTAIVQKATVSDSVFSDESYTRGSTVNHSKITNATFVFDGSTVTKSTLKGFTYTFGSSIVSSEIDGPRVEASSVTNSQLYGKGCVIRSLISDSKIECLEGKPIIHKTYSSHTTSRMLPPQSYDSTCQMSYDDYDCEF